MLNIISYTLPVPPCSPAQTARSRVSPRRMEVPLTAHQRQVEERRQDRNIQRAIQRQLRVKRRLLLPLILLVSAEIADEVFWESAIAPDIE